MTGPSNGSMHTAMFVEELGKLVEIPERCVAMNIRIRPGELVRVTCQVFAGKGSGETVTKRYTLTEDKQ